ncbi:hypothetical protein DV706_21200 (plasmid) [Natronorubrum bangense]|uniref:DUF8134 domain-containing protein n=1 Tax=Natronorubrum bangense TaxID=61858 RepID=A0A4D6HW51_9EURY|nr:hypothetical protein DV706_21200 [Natronorubrum bangense]
MPIALRTLDDGAWISVNDSRQVSVSDVWTLSRGVFCNCEPAYVLLEGFLDVRVVPVDSDLPTRLAASSSVSLS